MYRKTSGQSSFFEPQFYYSEFLPKDDWSDIFRDRIWPIIDEEKFRHLYQEEGGAPNKSIKLKLSLLIFMSWEQLTWRGAEFMFQRRLDWINATCSQLGGTSVDHTTLFKFYQALEEDEAAYRFFAGLTTAFIEECGVSVKKQRTDSFFMHGWLALLSRYGLFKETIRSFLQVLRKHQAELYNKIKDDLSHEYLKGEFDLTEKDREKAGRKTRQMADDLFLLKSAFENHEQIKGYDTFKTLVKVFEQQCEVKENHDDDSDGEKTPDDSQPGTNQSTPVKEADADDSAELHEARTAGFAGKDQGERDERPRIEIREKPEGERIISSPHNTDAVYTRKRNQKVVGHKAFVTETCDPNNPFQLITDVNLERATYADARETDRIEQRLEQNGFKPEALYGDAGFVNGETILTSEERGIFLEGPSSGRSQSIENYEEKDRPLDVADFEADYDTDTGILHIASCPAGHESEDWRLSEKTGKTLVHFDHGHCLVCGYQFRCPVKIGKRVSTLSISEAQHAGAVRHHRYMEDPDYRKECAVRSGAESLVNEVANTHGARQSKHKKEERSRLQLLFSAISCNVKRYINHTLTVEKTAEAVG